MNLIQRLATRFGLARFSNDESGAVTVDWVVLTAAVVALGLVVVPVISGGLATQAGNINTAIGTAVSP